MLKKCVVENLFKFSSLKSNYLLCLVLHLTINNLHLYKKYILLKCLILSSNSLGKNKILLIIRTNFYYAFSVLDNIDSLYLAAKKDLLLFLYYFQIMCRYIREKRGAEAQLKLKLNKPLSLDAGDSDMILHHSGKMTHNRSDGDFQWFPTVTTSDKYMTNSNPMNRGRNSTGAARTVVCSQPGLLWLVCEVYRSLRWLLPSLSLSCDALWKWQRWRRPLFGIFALMGTTLLLLPLVNVVLRIRDVPPGPLTSTCWHGASRELLQVFISLKRMLFPQKYDT